MDRRRFLNGVTCAGGVVAARAVFGLRSPESGAEVHVVVNPARQIASIPPDFMGLGYEISSVAVPDLLSAKNALYVQLVRTLGARGVIRVGGNTSDFSSFEAKGQPLSSPEGKVGSVVNDAVIRDLGTFLEATGWTLIWGLNLGNGREDNAVAEAKAVSDVAKSRLLAFEIGNEPDLFPRRFRKSDYGYEDYLADWRRNREALRKALPHAPLAGPDVAGATSWVPRFAADEGRDLKLLTHHYYREGERPTSTIDKLLHPDPKLGPELAKLRAASMSSGLPYRICEVNSFSGGGRPGVSDTLASALWVLDYMFTLASAGCAGVNMETGLNQRGFVSSYSPIANDEHGQYSAGPEYYGMLAFMQAGKGKIIETSLDTGGRNITGYATDQGKGGMTMTLINKETNGGCTAMVEGVPRDGRASVLRLGGPTMDSKSGVTLGGNAVNASGGWKESDAEIVQVSGGKLKIALPAASAAIVRLYS